VIREGSGMRAPFRESPDWGDWDDVDPHVPDTAPLVSVWMPEADEPYDGLVDVNGDPLYVEDETPFGFCSQRGDPGT
jgi:hypothetical protein